MPAEHRSPPPPRLLSVEQTSEELGIENSKMEKRKDEGQEDGKKHGGGTGLGLKW